MYIARVPNRNSPPAYLLRESYRHNGKVKNRTLANFSHLPEPQIELLREVLRGKNLVPLDQAFQIRRSLPHGHVACVLGLLRQLGLERLLAARRCRERDLVTALIVARILRPASKLATARGLARATRSSSLGAVLGLERVDEDGLYAALDWLLPRQPEIERRLAERHLADGALVLYDVSSSYYTGRRCPLARFGYNRDGKRRFPQIVYGLLCSREGCPVAIEVFEGNTADPQTLAVQLEKLRTRFGLRRVVVVGDRGVLTEARLREELAGHEGLDWITALRAPAIRQLAEQAALPRSLFDEQDLAEIAAPDYPGERLVVCRNPLLADERRRKREELLQATERALEKIAAATRRERAPLRGAAAIALRVGRVLDRHKMAKHFELDIRDDGFAYTRQAEAISAEAALDGLYVLRTSVPEEALSAPETVTAYKRLSRVEQAFRCLKTVDLQIRPIHHRLAGRVKAHAFLCLLAYYVEWHLRQAWAPLLFEDDDPAGAAAERTSPVAPARPSPRARAKAATKRTADGLPAHSFRTLLEDLATLTRNEVHLGGRGAGGADAVVQVLTSPTPVQARAFELLQLSP